MDEAELLRAEYLDRMPRARARLAREGAALVPTGAPPGSLGLELPPLLVARAKGARVTDIDGNDYVDLTMGFGVHFFGHAAPFLLRAQRQAQAEGLGAGLVGASYPEAARGLAEATGLPCIHFGTTGTEAVMSAVRMARNVTRRRLLVRFRGHYHGHSDVVLDSGPETLVLEYGSAEALATVRRRASEIAAVLVSPIAAAAPAHYAPEHLREMREVLRAAGAALIVDEVLTGFRFGPRPMSIEAGLAPDILVLGKLLGGGHPIGIIAATEHWMGALRESHDVRLVAPRTWLGGTYNRSALATRMCAVVLARIAASPRVYAELAARSARLVDTLSPVLAQHGVGSIAARASLVALSFRSPAVAELAALHLLTRGVFVRSVGGAQMTLFLSLAHGDRELEEAGKALAEAAAFAARIAP